jgi:transposase InsO family protein
MIDRTHALPVARQAKLVGISRSSAYYLPRAFSDAELMLMRRIDELHLEHPFAGARLLARMLRREGFVAGRKHVGTLMKRMGVEALYRKPNTSRRHAAHKIWPYLLRNRRIERSNQVWALDTTYIPIARRLRVSDGGGRLGEPPRARAPGGDHTLQTTRESATMIASIRHRESAFAWDRSLLSRRIGLAVGNLRGRKA